MEYLKLNPLWNDDQLWEGKTEWRKAKPDNGINLSIFRDAIVEKLGPKTEDIEYIDVTNEPEHIAFLGHDLNHK